MVLLLNVVFVILGFIGYFTFMPKYQMAAFNQSSSKASLFSGAVNSRVGWGRGVVGWLIHDNGAEMTCNATVGKLRKDDTLQIY